MSRYHNVQVPYCPVPYCPITEAMHETPTKYNAITLAAKELHPSETNATLAFNARIRRFSASQRIIPGLFVMTGEKTSISQPLNECTVNLSYLREIFAGAFNAQASEPEKAPEMITIDSDTSSDNGMLPDSDSNSHCDEASKGYSDAQGTAVLDSKIFETLKKALEVITIDSDDGGMLPDSNADSENMPKVQQTSKVNSSDSGVSGASPQAVRVVNMDVLAKIIKSRFVENSEVCLTTIHAPVIADEAYDKVMEAMKVGETQIIITVKRRSGNGPKKATQTQPQTKDFEAESLEALRIAALSTCNQSQKEAVKRPEAFKRLTRRDRQNKSIRRPKTSRPRSNTPQYTTSPRTRSSRLKPCSSHNASEHSKHQPRELSPASKARILALATLNQFRTNWALQAAIPPPPEPEFDDEFIPPPPPEPETTIILNKCYVLDNSTVVDMDVEEPELPTSHKPWIEDKKLQKKIRKCTKRRILTGMCYEDDLPEECSRPQSAIGKNFPTKFRKMTEDRENGHISIYKGELLRMEAIRAKPFHLTHFPRERQMGHLALNANHYFGLTRPQQKHSATSRRKW
ncbi:hypothetical protein L596_000793 [Steinernema carpocapsae]|uniref:Uncharacterized protein n=1 Tax=Steinernema carpocapsae TaxID=34508 RepID=A0A4U8UKG2_STECR|nr:hypothetical protein L596_000793 [Steinernema carpocapsae]